MPQKLVRKLSISSTRINLRTQGIVQLHRADESKSIGIFALTPPLHNTNPNAALAYKKNETFHRWLIEPDYCRLLEELKKLRKENAYLKTKSDAFSKWLETR